MSWIVYSLIAAFIWAVVNIVDKHILTKYIREPIVPVMIMGSVGLTASLLVYFIRGFSYLSNLHIAWAVLAGMLYILSAIFYFRAAKLEEISRIVPLYYLAPLFVLILAAVFLGEIFTPIKYAGIVLLVIGALMISKRNGILFKFEKAFIYMILCVLCLSIGSVIMKYLLNFTDYWTVFSYIRIGSVVALIPTWMMYYGSLRKMIRRNGPKVVSAMALNESLNIVAILCFYVAASVGYITLVEALVSIHTLFVFVIAALLSLYAPKILKEEIGHSTLVKKFCAIVLMIIGAIMIT